MKFTGNFHEDKITGYGKLEINMGLYHDHWKNFLVNGGRKIYKKY